MRSFVQADPVAPLDAGVPAAPLYPPAYPPAFPPAAASYPPQPQVMYPYMPSPVASTQKNKYGIMALIFGIISILELIGIAQGFVGNLFSWSSELGGFIGYIIGTLVFPVLAICMGITGIRACRRLEANNSGLAITGLIMGGVVIVFMAYVVVMAFSYL